MLGLGMTAVACQRPCAGRPRTRRLGDRALGDDIVEYWRAATSVTCQRSTPSTYRCMPRCPGARPLLARRGPVDPHEVRARGVIVELGTNDVQHDLSDCINNFADQAMAPIMDGLGQQHPRLLATVREDIHPPLAATLNREAEGGDGAVAQPHNPRLRRSLPAQVRPIGATCTPNAAGQVKYARWLLGKLDAHSPCRHDEHLDHHDEHEHDDDLNEHDHHLDNVDHVDHVDEHYIDVDPLTQSRSARSGRRGGSSGRYNSDALPLPSAGPATRSSQTRSGPLTPTLTARSRVSPRWRLSRTRAGLRPTPIGRGVGVDLRTEAIAVDGDRLAAARTTATEGCRCSGWHTAGAGAAKQGAQAPGWVVGGGVPSRRPGLGATRHHRAEPARHGGRRRVG